MQSQIALISCLLALHTVRYGLVFPLIPLFAQSLGASPAVIGVVVGAFGLLPLFLSIPSGGLADVFGTRRMLLLGVTCNIASSTIMLVAPTVSGLFAAQLLGGLGFQLHVVTCQSYVSRLPTAQEREKGFSRITFAAASGQALGPFLGGVIAGRWGYPTAFFLSLAISAAGLAAWRLPTQPLPAPRPRYQLGANLAAARSLFRDPRLRAVLLFSAVVIFVVSLRTSFLPVLLRKRGLDDARVGLLISELAGVSTLVRPFVGALLAAFGRRPLLAVAGATVVVGVGIAPWLDTAVALTVAMGIFGIGFGLTQPLSMVMVADLTTPERSGVAMGVRFTALTLANLLGPVVLGLVVEAASLEAAFYASAALMAAVAVRLLVFRPELLPGRREEPVL